tara:strand:- start:8192 stop:8653 length:462 start_codon:yes stop_codon:yes gene_type:complete
VSKDGSFKYHPIQMVDIDVLEITYKRKEQDSNLELDDDGTPEENHFRFFHAHSKLNDETQTFAVKVKAVVSSSSDEMVIPYTIIAEIQGTFEVQESFPLAGVEVFAERNAPLILYPYLREQVFGLASRAGVEQPILPLFEVPPFQIASSTDME